MQMEYKSIRSRHSLILQSLLTFRTIIGNFIRFNITKSCTYTTCAIYETNAVFKWFNITLLTAYAYTSTLLSIKDDAIPQKAYIPSSWGTVIPLTKISPTNVIHVFQTVPPYLHIVPDCMKSRNITHVTSKGPHLYLLHDVCPLPQSKRYNQPYIVHQTFGSWTD